NGDRHPLRNTRTLVDPAIGARLERDALDDLGYEFGNPHGTIRAVGPRFLPRDVHSQSHRLRIVRHDLAADAILERRDDLAARGIVFGIRREAELHVEWESHRVSFDLDIALLHDVEQ